MLRHGENGNMLILDYNACYRIGGDGLRTGTKKHVFKQRK